MLIRPIFYFLVLVTATIQLLLLRDKKKAASTESEGSLPVSWDSDSPRLQGSDIDEKKAIRTKAATLES